MSDQEGLPDEDVREAPGEPKEESGEPPGGDDYVTPFPADTGLVRDS